MLAAESQEPAKAHPPNTAQHHPDGKQQDVGTPQSKTAPEPSPELLALFRLLMREPPADHDFGTCLICKRYGITGI